MNKDLLALVSAGGLLSAALAAAAGYLFNVWEGRSRAWLIAFIGLLGISALTGLLAIRRSGYGLLAGACAVISLYFMWATVAGLRAL